MRPIFLSLIIVVIGLALETSHAQSKKESYVIDVLALQNVFADIAEKVKPTEELGEASVVSQPEESWIGLKVQNIAEDIASRLGIKDTEGVIVTDVSSEGAAVDAGIKTGDIIKEISGRKILNLSGYNAVINSIKDKNSVRFLIRRGKYSTYVIISR